MEWVETTGRTVDEAKDRALDQLGIDEQDAEFEVLEEPKAGLFGRVRGEARVRARIRPTQPRPKAERRDRRRRKDQSAAGAAAPGGEADAAPEEAVDTDAPAEVRSQARGAKTADRAKQRTPRRSARPSASTQEPERAPRSSGGDDVTTTLPVGEQADRMQQFLEGLLDAFDYEGTVRQERIDDETIELHVEGGDLGLMIGPKGATLSSIQELARVVATRDVTTEGRVRVDVGGYRQRRREALERFTQKVAAEVVASGKQKVLEPMSPPDRKVVHDTANTIDGVRTYSEGEEPGRRVVIAPL